MPFQPARFVPAARPDLTFQRPGRIVLPPQGPVNLIQPNPSFEGDTVGTTVPTGWDGVAFSSNATLTDTSVSAAWAADGTQSYHIAGTFNGGGLNGDADLFTHGWPNQISVTPGQVYSVACVAHPITNPGYMSLRVNWSDENGVGMGGADSPAYNAGAGFPDGSVFVMRNEGITPPAGATRMRFQWFIAITAPAGTNIPFEVYVDDFFLINTSTVVMPGFLNPGVIAGTGAATTAVTAATQVATGQIAGTSTTSAFVTAATQIPLAQVAGVSTSSATVTAATGVVLGQVVGVGTSSVSVTAPTQVQLGAVSGVGSSTVTVTAPTKVQFNPVNGAGTASLGVTAATQVPFNPVAGSSTTSAFVTAATQIPLNPVSGSSTTTASVTAATQVVLGTVTGSSTVTGTVGVLAQLALGQIAGTSTAGLALSAAFQGVVDVTVSDSAVSATGSDTVVWRLALGDAAGSADGADQAATNLSQADTATSTLGATDTALAAVTLKDET